jgi:hypothetical protein
MSSRREYMSVLPTFSPTSVSSPASNITRSDPIAHCSMTTSAVSASASTSHQAHDTLAFTVSDLVKRRPEQDILLQAWTVGYALPCCKMAPVPGWSRSAPRPPGRRERRRSRVGARTGLRDHPTQAHAASPLDAHFSAGRVMRAASSAPSNACISDVLPAPVGPTTRLSAPRLNASVPSMHSVKASAAGASRAQEKHAFSKPRNQSSASGADGASAGSACASSSSLWCGCQAHSTQGRLTAYVRQKIVHTIEGDLGCSHPSARKN